MDFIDGVTLIDIITVPTFEGICIMITLVLIGLIIGVATFISVINNFRSVENPIGVFVLGLIMEGVALGFAMLGIYLPSIDNLNILNMTKPSGEYRVVVDNRCNMNEFYEKYEIIDYDNGCYTISIK